MSLAGLLRLRLFHRLFVTCLYSFECLLLSKGPTMYARCKLIRSARGVGLRYSVFSFCFGSVFLFWFSAFVLVQCFCCLFVFPGLRFFRPFVLPVFLRTGGAAGAGLKRYFYFHRPCGRPQFLFLAALRDVTGGAGFYLQNLQGVTRCFHGNVSVFFPFHVSAVLPCTSGRPCFSSCRF